MNLSFWMATMHVMGQLGIFKPYLIFIQRVLDVLDRACEEEFGLDEENRHQGEKVNG